METSWKESVKNHNNYQSGFTAQDARILAVDDTAMNLTVLQGLLKLPFEKEVFEGLLETLRSSMEEFDLDRADETMALIEKYAYPEELDKEIEKLKAAVSDVDSDGVVEIVGRIKVLL